MCSFVNYKYLFLSFFYYKKGLEVLLVFDIGSGSDSSNCKCDSFIMCRLWENFIELDTRSISKTKKFKDSFYNKKIFVINKELHKIQFNTLGTKLRNLVPEWPKWYEVNAWVTIVLFLWLRHFLRNSKQTKGYWSFHFIEFVLMFFYWPVKW